MENTDDPQRRAFRNATPKAGLIRRKVKEVNVTLSPDQLSNHALSGFFIWGLEGRKDQADARTIIRQKVKTSYFTIENVFATYRKTVNTLNDIFLPGLQMIFLLKAGNSIEFNGEVKVLLKKDKLYLFSIPPKGCAFRIKPGEYRFVILQLEPELVYRLTTDYLFFNNIFSKYQNGIASMVYCDADMLMVQTIENLCVIMKLRESVNQFHIEANCMHILSCAIENIVRENKESTVHHTDEMLKSTIQLITDNYSKSNILEEIEKLGYKEQNVNSAMLQRYGTSLENFIKTIRLKNAYTLLTNGVFIVAEIVEIIGYSDKTKFEEDFMEYHQISAHSLLARSQKK